MQQFEVPFASGLCPAGRESLPFNERLRTFPRLLRLIGMGATQTKFSAERLVWQTYRDAFHEFKQDTRRLAEIKARSFFDPAEAETAMLRVENARLAYNDARDALASYLMPPQFRAAFWAIPAAPGGERRRVKNIAELLWEMAGKPQGSADDDWYRAERVVRHAPVCCAR